MRTPIPEDIAADVLFRHHHTCCVCNIPGRPVQIHHIDEDPSNNDPTNLAVVCFECHDATQVRGGFGRKLRAFEIIKYRDDWVSRISERKRRADELVIGQAVQVVETPLGEKWEAPSEHALAALINSLPGTLRAAYDQARVLWANGSTAEMVDGSELIIAVLERAWLELSKWYPPNHFGGVPADQYIRDFVQGRAEWHYAVQEPDGVGTGGSIVRTITALSTAEDMQSVIAQLVLAVGHTRLESFDGDSWQQRWESAKKDPSEMTLASKVLKRLFQK